MFYTRVLKKNYQSVWCLFYQFGSSSHIQLNMQLRHIHLRNPIPPPSPPLRYCPNFQHIHGTVSVTCSCVHIVFLASLVVLIKPRVKWIIFFASVGPTLPLVQGHIFIFFSHSPSIFSTCSPWSWNSLCYLFLSNF